MAERLAFLAEWYNDQAQLNVEYTLLYYPAEKAVEMIDVKSKRTFLKKTPYTVDEKELRIGGQVTVYSRLLRIVGYADAYTQQLLGTSSEEGIVLVTVDGLTKVGDIFCQLFGNGCPTGVRLVELRTVYLTVEEYQRFHSTYKPQTSWQFGNSTGRLPFLVIQVMAGSLSNRVSKSLEGELAANYVMFVSDKSGLQSLFASPQHVGISFEKASLCLVKPHVVQQIERVGPFLKALFQDGALGFVAMQLFRVEKPDAEEFYKVYKGVLPGVQDYVDELCSGASLAIALVQPSSMSGTQNDVVKTARERAGPTDVEIAKTLAPNSLRALYGLDPVRNGVHVTDLPEDGRLECEYFFNILNS